MKRFAKKALAAAMALTLAVGMMTGCTTSGDSATQNGNKVLFTYDNTEVTLKEAWIYAKMTGKQYDSYYGMYYGSDFWLTPMGTDADGNAVTMEDYVKDQVISQIKLVTVLNNKAEEYKISLDDDEKAKCAEYAKAFVETDEGAEIIKECGASEADITTLYEKNMIASKVQKEVVKDVDTNVSDDEARETKISRIVYETTKTDDEGQTVAMTDEEKAATLATAQAALKKIQDGTSLADVAAEAEFTNTSETYAAGESEEGADFEAKIAALKDGELLGEVVECDNGYVVAQLEALTDAEATASHKESIVAERQKTAFNEKYQEWVKDLEEAWDSKKDIDQELWAEVVLHSAESTATEAETETQPASEEATTEAAAEATTEAAEATTAAAAEATTQAK